LRKESGEKGKNDIRGLCQMESSLKGGGPRAETVEAACRRGDNMAGGCLAKVEGKKPRKLDKRTVRDPGGERAESRA